MCIWIKKDPTWRNEKFQKWHVPESQNIYRNKCIVKSNYAIKSNVYSYFSNALSWKQWPETQLPSRRIRIQQLQQRTLIQTRRAAIQAEKNIYQIFMIQLRYTIQSIIYAHTIPQTLILSKFTKLLQRGALSCSVLSLKGIHLCSFAHVQSLSKRPALLGTQFANRLVLSARNVHKDIVATFAKSFRCILRCLALMSYANISLRSQIANSDAGRAAGRLR